MLTMMTRPARSRARTCQGHPYRPLFHSALQVVAVNARLLNGSVLTRAYWAAEVEDSRARRKELNKRNSRKQRKKDKDRLSQMSQQLEQLQQENGTLRKIHGLDDGHTSLPSTRGAAYHCQQLGSILELVHFDWLLLSICQGAPVTLWPELAQTMQVKGMGQRSRWQSRAEALTVAIQGHSASSWRRR